MFTFEIASYPDTPADFALFGALTWVESLDPGHPDNAALTTLQKACELAGLTVPDLLDMVQRRHLTIHYVQTCG